VSNLRPLPTDLRDHLSELTGNEYKVWTVYYLRTGDYDLTSHPSNETIGKDTGLTNRTVKTSKAGLRAKGWLAYTGDYKQPRSAEGVYAVPVMEVRLPWKPDWSAVVMDVSTAYDAFTTVVQKVTHGTVVQNLHPEGSIGFGVGLGSDFSSSSPSTIVRGAPHPIVKEGERKTEAKSKPENLEPTPEPKPTPTPVKVRCAPDGTPWPSGFDSWMNARRLRWLEAHGWKQGRMAEASPQKTSTVVDREGTPTATATPTPLHDPPGSAVPPIPDCVRCGELCAIQQGEWVCHGCHLRQPVVRPPEPELDNWDEL
jgi:hypothetical protein